MKNVAIVGVGIHPFGRFDYGYRQIGEVAMRDCLADAKLQPEDVDMVLVANVGAEMAKGHNIVNRVRYIGKPIINVEAACASGGSALSLGASLIESGAVKTVLCLGVEKAPRGFIAGAGFENWQIESGLGVNPLYFSFQAQDLMRTTDATLEDLADVAVKNHGHSVHNPHAMYRREFTRGEVLASRPVCDPLTLLMLCTPNEGAAAVALMDKDEAAKRGFDNSIRIGGIGLASRATDDWFVPAPSLQSEMTSISARAADTALEQAGMGVDDIDLVECQDTDTASELIAYSDLGLCNKGEEAELLRSGATTLGGSIPVNVSGGLLSKGEPLGASGLGQVHELVTQLRGTAGPRQVKDARVGMAHVMGAGHNACVVVVQR
ncbi:MULTISPECIES: thiolase family protein [Rhodococcus]|uniref:Thiolase family protein n=1 Tax=Rhodococcus opacus TaxID=37919 RepID=A0AAX3YFM1_RHOOP|nr:MULTISPECIES: thiolase family protein [Rhodococcus]MCZ4587749.1 thiolase family protein [Rhodococcus opacus]MDI9940130.1 thiolase family protein [Rhodococcus sp. IEGM 1351]QZS59076.1 thiolase family protein [Rhodococcus opacus]UZG55074.1 thiolase family protein [Rhodococcus opacus]WLF46898.1 thiolase family protein [Rhodococcus opacus]